MRKSAVLALAIYLGFGVAVASFAAASPQTTVPVPPLAGRVNDLAHLLAAADAAALEAKLADYEKATGNQLVLLTVPTLGGFPLEEYSLNVAEAWKLGRKGVSNGVLLFVAKDERKIRIEVGYGLEPSLTDAVTSFIISDKMTPAFRNEDYKGGITAAFEAMMLSAEGKLDMKGAGGGGPRQLPLALFILFALLGYGFMGMISYFSLFMKGAGVIFYVMLLAGFGLAGSALNIRGSKIGYALFFVFAFGFPVAKIIVGKTPFGKAKIKKFEAMQVSHVTSGGYRSSGGHSSFHSSSGGGGGFSGGGGSFGGGGASGGW
jgi:uncharacterized protein